MEFLPTLAAVLAAAAFLWALGIWVWYARKPLTIAAPDQPEKRDYWYILGMVLLVALAVYIVGILAATRSGIEGTILQKLERIYTRADAHHYLDIASQGYVNTGESRLYIVFFPLFPALVRLMSVLTAGNLFLAALLVNLGCIYGACVVVYRLGCLDHTRAVALRAVRYLLLFPAAFFYFIPYTESTFLLCAALSLYYSRKRSWVLAGVFAGLCALSRLPGVLCAAPLVLEAYYAAREQEHWLKAFCQKAAWALLALAGVAIYLGINWIVTGDPLMFLTHQREHWNQTFRVFTHAVSTITGYLLKPVPQAQCLLWSGQFVAIALFLVLLNACVKRLRAPQAAYCILCFFVVTSASWLLSAPRYLMVVFPVYYVIAMATRKSWIDVPLSTLSAAGLLLYNYYFALGYSIY